MWGSKISRLSKSRHPEVQVHHLTFRNLRSAFTLSWAGSNVADSLTLLLGNSADKKIQLTSFICGSIPFLQCKHNPSSFHQNLLNDCIQKVGRINFFFFFCFLRHLLADLQLSLEQVLVYISQKVKIAGRDGKLSKG